MKLFIPTLGTKLVLSKSWTFLFEDNMWNETFWLAIHGQPVRQKYFSGYDRTTGKHETSPVKTTVCDSECFHKATPIKTTFPKGTTLYIEKISIRKGLRGDDHLILRIPTNRTSAIPSGKFRVSLNEINKMDAVVELVNKYPEGKFILQIIEGKEWKNCTCRTYPCHCRDNQPHFVKQFLIWMSDPESSRGGRVAKVEHYTNDVGVDNITVESQRYYNHSEGYSKSFASMRELLGWAEKKKFTQAHLDAFATRYTEKKAQWEQDKQGIVAV